MANKASMPNAMPKTKWKITTDDESTGSIMDTDRPYNAPYQVSRQIGPQSKTDFGKDQDKGD